MMTIARALCEAAALLASDEGRIDVELLLAQVLRRPRSWLLAHDRDQLEPDSRALFSAFAESPSCSSTVAKSATAGMKSGWLDSAFSRL